MNILITGGTGYIGSHVATALSDAGYGVVLVDNFSNSDADVLNRLTKLLGHKPEFVECDLRDQARLDELFEAHAFDGVIHCAGLKAVGESVEDPLTYYDNNVVGTVNLLKAMDRKNVRTLVFSSSATVYGDPRYLPIDEEHSIEPANPYGQTKAQVERILSDLAVASDSWKIASLRYFNPVGAHESGLIAENPRGVPNNLMPYIVDVALKRREALTVFGTDYDTLDGTGVRDYIHVMDLAEGHQAAVKWLLSADTVGIEFINLGTGKGYSVLEVQAAFETASGCSVPVVMGERRPGDIATCYAATGKAKQLLGWQATRDLSVMCQDLCRAVL